MSRKKQLFDFDFDLLVEEAAKQSAMDIFPKSEKKMQLKKAKELEQFRHSESDKNVDEAEDEKENNKGPLKPKSSKLPAVTLEKIIDKLNSIRAGRSLKSPDSKKDLKRYYTRLNGSERIALYAFLTGLSKIMADEDDKVGSEVAPPRDEPYDINMKKVEKKQKVASKKAAGEESPIVVGESANKSREKKILRGNLK